MNILSKMLVTGGVLLASVSSIAATVDAEKDLIIGQIAGNTVIMEIEKIRAEVKEDVIISVEQSLSMPAFETVKVTEQSSEVEDVIADAE